MGVGARLHAISQEFYEAALAGDINDEMLPPGEVIECVDLESAWHAMHYLITGDLSLTFLLGGLSSKAFPNIARCMPRKECRHYANLCLSDRSLI